MPTNVRGPLSVVLSDEPVTLDPAIARSARCLTPPAPVVH